MIIIFSNAINARPNVIINGVFAFYFLSDINLKYRYSTKARKLCPFVVQEVKAGEKKEAKLHCYLSSSKGNGVANEKADEAKRSGNHP